MTDTLPTTVKRHRSLRFSLRTLLVAMTVLCVWLGIKINAARRQHEAVTAILKAGGYVLYDYQMVPVSGLSDVFNPEPNVLPPTPTWLRNIFGDDFFSNVVTASFRRGESLDLNLAELTKLPSLRDLSVTANRHAVKAPNDPCLIQDADLEVLGQLSQLRRLALFEQGVLGRGLRSLAKSTHLKSLLLTGTYVQDSGMEQIGKLTSLQELVLSAERVSKPGFHHLANLAFLNLTLLSPSICEFSDTDLKHLCEVSNLQVLSIHRSHITNEDGLKYLQNLPKLLNLFFGDTDLTDASLQHLKRLTKLEHLDIHGTRVTPEGIRELQKALLNTKISGP